MKTLFSAGVLAAALALAPPASAAISTITASGAGQLWCVNPSCQGTSAIPVKQGTMPTLTLEGEWMDWCDGASVSNSTGIAISARSAGQLSRKCVVTLSLTNAAVAGDHTVTIKRGASSDTFRIKVVRNGRLDSVSPTTVTANQPVDLTFTGQRIGNAEFDKQTPAALESFTILSSNEDTITVRARWKSSGSTQSAGFRLFERSIVPQNFYGTAWRTVTVQPDQAAASCTTRDYPAPGLTSPGNGATLTFPPGSPAQTQITFRWTPVNVGDWGVQRYVLSVVGPNNFSQTVTTNLGETSRSMVLNRPGTYQWRVRVFNCGLASLSGGPFTVTLQ